jgi:Fe-S cluster biogenesis protein NfuA
MTEPAAPPRMRDEQVRQALTRLNELLGELEETPGPAGDIAREALSALTRVYGEALARALGCVADTTRPRAAFLGDELLGHLLVLHGIHPEAVGDRVARVIRDMSEAVGDRGGTVELVGIEDGVAIVRLSKHGCGSSIAGIDEVIREEVLAMAPELSGVEVVSGAAREAAFIPLGNLMARPPAAETPV